MNYRIIIAMLAIIPLFITQCKKKEDTARLIFMTGDVTINDTAAIVGQTISSDAVIKTGEVSFCDIKLGEEIVFRFQQNSEGSIASVKDANEVTINSGSIITIARKLQKSGKNVFRVRTPTTVASIRGTSFFIKLENEYKTYLCDCNGVVQVMSKNGSATRSIEANHHKAFRIAKTGSDFTIEQAIMLYHTDDDMQQVAEKLGVTIDWAKVDR